MEESRSPQSGSSTSEGGSLPRSRSLLPSPGTQHDNTYITALLDAFMTLGMVQRTFCTWYMCLFCLCVMHWV